MSRFGGRLHVAAVCLGACLLAGAALAADSASPGGLPSSAGATASDGGNEGDSSLRLLPPHAATNPQPQAARQYPVRQASQYTAVSAPAGTNGANPLPPGQPTPAKQSPPTFAPAPAGWGGSTAASAETLPTESQGPVEAAADGDLPECPGDRLIHSRQWFGGAEYMLLRMHEPGNSAYEISPNGGTGTAVENVNFDPPYSSSFRVFLGYDIGCNEKLRMSYAHITNEANESASTPDGDVILSPLGADLGPGDSITATDHVLLNIWDIEDVRNLSLANCGCGECHDWEVNWSWGVRIVDLNDTVTNVVTGPDAGVFNQQSTFVGAGPRMGLEVRRQLGCSATSAFVGVDAALLLGDQRTAGSDTAGGLHAAQTVPDFDFRVGLSWQPTCHFTFTGGWIMETFGDATSLNQSAGLALVQPPQANNLSYDGLFLRGEFRY